MGQIFYARTNTYRDIFYWLMNLRLKLAGLRSKSFSYYPVYAKCLSIFLQLHNCVWTLWSVTRRAQRNFSEWHNPKHVPFQSGLLVLRHIAVAPTFFQDSICLARAASLMGIGGSCRVVSVATCAFSLQPVVRQSKCMVTVIAAKWIPSSR